MGWYVEDTVASIRFRHYDEETGKRVQKLNDALYEVMNEFEDLNLEVCEFDLEDFE